MTHLFILSFQSLFSAPFCGPLSSFSFLAVKLRTSCCSAEGELFPMPEFPLREFDPLSIVPCRFLRFALTALHLGPFVFSGERFLMLLIWIFRVNVFRHCRVWIYYVQWSERGGGCWWEKVLGGGKKEGSAFCRDA